LFCTFPSRQHFTVPPPPLPTAPLPPLGHANGGHPAFMTRNVFFFLRPDPFLPQQKLTRPSLFSIQGDLPGPHPRKKLFLQRCPGTNQFFSPPRPCCIFFFPPLDFSLRVVPISWHFNAFCLCRPFPCWEKTPCFQFPPPG